MTRTITVKGVGCASAKPDYITILMSLETRNKDYEKAMLEAGKRINTLHTVVTGLGYEKDALKTSNFRVDPRYESVRGRDGEYTRVFSGYACCHQLKLAFDFDSKQLGKVITAIAESGVSPELDIEFTVKNPAKVSETLLISATENAHAKAEILCRASGAQLGQLLTIDYNWGEINVVSSTSYANIECLKAKSIDIEIDPDDIDVSDSATFIWEIA